MLYKYLTIDSAIKVIENKTLKYSSPSAFNDPFDSCVIPRLNKAYWGGQIRAWFTPQLSHLDIAEMEIALQEAIDEVFEMNNVEEIATRIYPKSENAESLIAAINTSAILCLSAVPDDILCGHIIVEVTQV